MSQKMASLQLVPPFDVHTYWTSDSLCNFPVVSKTQSELASHSSISPSARRPLCRSRAPAGPSTDKWRILLERAKLPLQRDWRPCSEQAWRQTCRQSSHRLMCNARRSVVQGKAAKGFAYLHRFAVYVACLAGPFRAPEVQPRLWCSRRTRRSSTRDLQQCDNLLPLARVPCPRPPRAGPKD